MSELNIHFKDVSLEHEDLELFEGAHCIGHTLALTVLATFGKSALQVAVRYETIILSFISDSWSSTSSASFYISFLLTRSRKTKTIPSLTSTWRRWWENVWCLFQASEGTVR